MFKLPSSCYVWIVLCTLRCLYASPKRIKSKELLEKKIEKKNHKVVQVAFWSILGIDFLAFQCSFIAFVPSFNAHKLFISWLKCMLHLS